jgi:hypothetical protein
MEVRESLLDVRSQPGLCAAVPSCKKKKKKKKLDGRWGERFPSRVSAGESRRYYRHTGRSLSPIDAHVPKKTAHFIGLNFLC